MLVLSRSIDEVVVVGSNIKVKVLEINGNQVRLGIEAPRTIAVNREEVQQRIQAGEPRPTSKTAAQKASEVVTLGGGKSRDK
jgi:carbon storage regulator